MTVQPGTYSEVRLGWWASPEDRIPETAIEARPSQQIKATIPVTHYVDLKRRCRDCSRPFIFFAEEQQYWCETLHFYVGADCVRCTECRKEQRRVNGLAEKKVAGAEKIGSGHLFSPRAQARLSARSVRGRPAWRASGPIVATTSCRRGSRFATRQERKRSPSDVGVPTACEGARMVNRLAVGLKITCDERSST
ncbi:zinc-ribbon domain containing protein [Allorhodopirellula heiligendammensis]